MATIEVELRTTKKKSGKQPLVLRVISGEKVMRKNIGFDVYAKDWDDARKQVKRSEPLYTEINDTIAALLQDAGKAKAKTIIKREAVTADSIMQATFATHDFYEIAEARMNEFANAGKHWTATNYSAMITSLKGFAAKLLVEEITPDFIRRYRVHLDQLGKKHNTQIGYLTKIRATLNRTDLKTENPFIKEPIGGYRRSKAKALDMSDIDKLRGYVPRNRGEMIAKDTFLFSFYAAGMRSSDVLQLRWSNIVNGRIDFNPMKVEDTTDVNITIPINAPLQEILDKQDRAKPTVFNLVTIFGKDKAACKQRAVIQANINDSLKAIALYAGIHKHIMFKLARTTFAQIANELSGRNVYGIQQAMGHSNIKTTEIYLGSDRQAVDEICRAVYG